jgi:putative ABC transport system permease protein
VNDLTLMRKNLFRKPLRTSLLLISIFIAFLVFGVMVSFNLSLTAVRNLPTRMVTLSKINFTESLPIAHYDKIVRTPGVVVASHANWFGGYYRDPVKGAVTTFAVDPETYLKVHADDIVVAPAARDAFLHERTAMLVPPSVIQRFGWRVGQQVPLNSNLYTNKDGTHTWRFTLVGLTQPANAGVGYALIRYDYFNDTINFGHDRVGWVPFLTSSAAVNDQVAHAIDARFANSQDETSTQDEATFNRSFLDQLGNIVLVITLVVGSAFTAILLVVGTTMALAVRERTREIGVMKTLGFSSRRILIMVLGESLLLAFLGAALGLLGADGLLALMAKAARGASPIHFAIPVIGWAALIALVLGLVTGLAPALGAYRMRITDAFGRR